MFIFAPKCHFQAMILWQMSQVRTIPFYHFWMLHIFLQLVIILCYICCTLCALSAILNVCFYFVMHVFFTFMQLFVDVFSLSALYADPFCLVHLVYFWVSPWVNPRSCTYLETGVQHNYNVNIHQFLKDFHSNPL